MSGSSDGELRVEGNSISFSKISFPRFLDYAIAYGRLDIIQAGFDPFLLLKQRRPFGGADRSVSRCMNLVRESSILLGKPDDLRMLTQLRLLFR